MNINRLLLCISGYTVHDALDIIAHDFKGSPGLLIHHVVVSIPGNSVMLIAVRSRKWLFAH